MRILRRTIRRLILESEVGEHEKYHDRDRAIAAIQELTSIFKDAYAFEVGSWSNKFTVHEMYCHS